MIPTLPADGALTRRRLVFRLRDSKATWPKRTSGIRDGQLDFSLHRTFALAERLRLEFRGEMFNITNHSNFGPPNSRLNAGSLFGVPTQMLGSSLASSPSGVSPLYQVGGPRSIQLGAHFVF
jgi:hypothetical protein